MSLSYNQGEMTNYSNPNLIGVEVIFVPEYIVSALKSRGSSLVEFEAMMKQYLHRRLDFSNPLLPNGTPVGPDGKTPIVSDVNVFKSYLETKLSKIDIEDLYIFNVLDNIGLSLGKNYKTFICSAIDTFSNTPLANTLSPYNGNTNFDSKRVHKTIETLYDNNMRDANNDLSTFYTQVGTDSLFVVLKCGFTNYILDNDLNTKVSIFSKLINIAVSSFGESRVVNSALFYKYLKLVKLKNS